MRIPCCVAGTGWCSFYFLGKYGKPSLWETTPVLSKEPSRLDQKWAVHSEATYLQGHHCSLLLPKHTPLHLCVQRRGHCVFLAFGSETGPPRKLGMSSWVSLSGMTFLVSLNSIELQRFDLIVYCSFQKAFEEVHRGCPKFYFNPQGPGHTPRSDATS